MCKGTRLSDRHTVDGENTNRNMDFTGKVYFWQCHYARSARNEGAGGK